MAALGADARAAVSPGTLFRELDGEAVLLNLERGHYYGLDEVGARILSLLVDGQSLQQVHSALLAEYEVPSDPLWEDIVRLVGELQAEGLVVVHDPEDSSTR
jgi:hypothetical protein